MRLTGALKSGQGVKAHQAGQPFAGQARGGDGVGLLAGLHLQAVLHVAQKQIGLAQCFGILGGEKVVGSQLFQGGNGRGLLEERLLAGVEQLQGLRDEFDFADAAAAQFNIALQFARLHHLVFQAGFHRRHAAEGAFREGARITEGLDHLQKFRAQFRVAGHGARLDQHHPLPRLAPLRVIGFKTFQRAHERAGGGLRAEAQIHPVEHALRGQAADFGDHAFGQAREEDMAGQALAAVFARTRRRFENVPLLAVNKHDVHVGTVIQFLSAQLAQAENAKLRGLPASVGSQMKRPAQAAVEGWQAKAQDGVQADVGHVGNLAGDGQRAVQAGQVARGDAQHFALFEFAQFGEGGFGFLAGQAGFEPLPDLVAQALLAPGMEQRARLQQRPEPIGMRRQQLTRHLRTGEQRNKNARLLGGRLLDKARRRGFPQTVQGGPGPGRVGAGFQC